MPFLVIGLFAVVMLVGCEMQAPLIIIVTPTHVAVAPTVITVLPTRLPTLIPTRLPLDTLAPTTDGVIAQVAATVTPSKAPAIAATQNLTPSATFGSIVGPSYTPPTRTSPTPLPPTIAPTVTSTPTPAVSPTPLPVLQSKLMGIQIQGYLSNNDWQNALNQAKQLGVGWIKEQIQWSLVEPARGNYNDIDRTIILDIQQAHIQGFKTLISVAKAPSWARAAGATDDGPPTNPADLGGFLTHLVHEIKPEFIDAIEVWNEPNLRREWSGSALNPATYLKYFDAAYTAIRREEQVQVAPQVAGAAHHIVIIAAAPASATPDTDTSMNDRTWIKGLYSAGFAHYGGDVALGAHPYGWANPPDAVCCNKSPGVTGWFESPGFYFKNTLDDYRQIMTSSNHAAAKLWITEFGWATYDGLHRSDGSPANPPTDSSFGWLKLINQSQQADYLIRAFTIAQHPPYADFLGPMMLWNLNFGMILGMTDGGREEAGFSLLDFKGTPRPAYLALRDAPKQ